jgi:murein DD-endopeptidase MepM/ murein hydrolase activator NlpD
MPTKTDNSPDQDHQNGGGYDVAGNKQSTPLGGFQGESISGMSSGDRSREVADLEAAVNGPAAGADKGSGATPAKGLFKQETGGNDREDGQGLYKPTAENRKEFRKRGRQLIKVGKKQGIIGGFSGLLLGGVFFGLSFTAGPLSFIHMAELESHAHNASQKNQSDDRFAHDIRYLRRVSKGNIYKTRMGPLGNFVATQYTKALAKQGINLTYDKDGNAKYAFDPAHENWKDKSPLQIQDELRAKGNPATVVEETINGKKMSVINISGAENDSSTRIRRLLDIDRSNIIKGLSNEAGFGRSISYIGNRVLKPQAGVTFNPFNRARDKIYEGIAKKIANPKDAETAQEAEFNKEGQAYANGGEAAEQVTLDNAENAKDDPKATEAGNVATATDAGNQLSSDANAAKTDIQNGAPDQTDKAAAKVKSSIGKIAGKVAGGIGIACVLKGIDSNSAKINQAEVVVPLIRIGAEMESVGSKVKYGGTDVSSTMLKQYSKKLYDPATKSLWTDAAPVRALEGENPADGMPVPPTIANITKGTPFFFLNEPPFNTFLDPICGVVEGFFKIPVLGTVTNWALAAANPIQYVAFGEGVKIIARWVSAVPIDLTVKGADFGSYVDYGVKLGANQAFITNGAKKLSSTEAKKLAEANNAIDQQEFNSRSLAYRLFNTSDYRSLISRIVDKQTPSPTENIARIGGSLTNIGKLFASDLSSVLFHAASADSTTDVTSTPQDYNYNLPTYGFSDAELSSPLVDDPFQNANDVADILTQNAAAVKDNPHYIPNYVAQADRCFKVQLTQVADPNNQGQMIWDTNATQDDTKVQFYGKDYQSDSTSAMCAGDTTDASGNITITDQAWFKLRFFIFDTANTKSAACYGGDAQSCTDVGFDSGSTSAAASSGSLGISPDGFVFPAKTTKTKIKAGSDYNGQNLAWCYTSQTNCHHDYNAADIFGPTGTPVVAVRDGSIVYEVNDASGGTGSFVILKTAPDKQGKSYIYYYGHLGAGSVTVQSGQTVKAGDVVGAIGTAADAEGTAPHLHIDAELSPPATTREPCTNAACAQAPFNFLNIQPTFTAAYNGLPD